MKYMLATGFPIGLSAVGFGDAEVAALVDGAFPQQRVLKNGPQAVTREDPGNLFNAAFSY